MRGKIQLDVRALFACEGKNTAHRPLRTPGYRLYTRDIYAFKINNYIRLSVHNNMCQITVVMEEMSFRKYTVAYSQPPDSRQVMIS